jgi:hypothetical protein
VRAFLEKEGVAALVFEYVPGVPLTRVLRQSEARGVRLPDAAAWHIVVRVLDGLAYAHAFHDDSDKPTPIVHRDLSPANVLVDWNGGVKIADFGIAKVIGESPATRLGLIKGTPGCMAPEQARGERVDERVDVYAAALLVWRFLTGRRPFAKHLCDEMELLRAMRHPNIPPLVAIRPDLPAPVLDAVAQAMRPEPHERTITAGAFAEVIRAHAEVPGGAAALAELLGRWRTTFQRATGTAGGPEGDASLGVPDHTLRYEQAAFDDADDWPLDAPTYEARALPTTGEHDRPAPTAVAVEAPQGGEPQGEAPKGELVAPAATAARPSQKAMLAVGAVGLAVAGLGVWWLLRP